MKLNPDFHAGHIMACPDLELLKESVKYTKRMADTEPFKSLVIKEVDPGKENSTDEEIKGQLTICSYRLGY